MLYEVITDELKPINTKFYAWIMEIYMKSVYQNWNMDAELPLEIYRISNLSFYPHFHNELEFVYVERGDIIVGVNEEKRRLQAGDMVICCSNDIHYYESKDLESKTFMLRNNFV